jgi:hypothetical protein
VQQAIRLKVPVYKVLQTNHLVRGFRLLRVKPILQSGVLQGKQFVRTQSTVIGNTQLNVF